MPVQPLTYAVKELNHTAVVALSGVTSCFLMTEESTQIPADCCLDSH